MAKFIKEGWNYVMIDLEIFKDERNKNKKKGRKKKNESI